MKHHTPIKRWIAIFFLSLLLSPAWAQRRWDGGANDGQWSSPANWFPDGLPGDAEDVLLDNSLLNTTYTVQLPDGSTGIRLNSLHLLPDPASSITLLIPASNTAAPALYLSGLVDPIIIGAGALLRNASGALSGEVITLLGNMSILDGGRYLHQTARGNASLIDHLSHAPGTERGVFEFDVPGTSGYTVSLTGNYFGTLLFNAAAAGGAKSYSGSGASDLHINGDLLILPGAQLTSTLSANILVGGSLVVNGNLNLQPATPGSTARSLVFTGNHAHLSGNGQINLSSHLRDILVDSSASVTLDRDVDIPLATQRFRVRTGGIIRFGVHQISGAGAFAAEDSSTLYIGHPSGIRSDGSGNVLTSVRQFPWKASYIYDGDGPQSSGDALPDSVLALGVDKPNGMLQLTRPVQTTDLSLQRGNLITTSAGLTLTEGRIRSPLDGYGKIDEGWEQSHVVGPLSIRSSRAGMLAFPVGDSSSFAPLTLDKVGNGTAIYTVGYQHPFLPDTTPLSPALEKIKGSEYWSIVATGPSPATEARLGLSWRPTTEIRAEDLVGNALRTAGRQDDGSGWRWVPEGTGASYEGDTAYGWVHGLDAVTSFRAFAIATVTKSSLLAALPSLRCHTEPSGTWLEWGGDLVSGTGGAVIEKSTDGRHFLQLAEPRKEDLSFMDPEIGNGSVFYRLGLTQGLDSIAYSNTCRVDISPVPRITLYPNPARDMVRIEAPKTLKGCRFRILSINGQVVKSGSLPDGDTWLLRLDDLTTGYHVLELTAGADHYSSSFLNQ